MQINDDVWVTVRYRLFDVQGEPLEAVERELTFLQGGYGFFELSIFVRTLARIIVR